MTYLLWIASQIQAVPRTEENKPSYMGEKYMSNIVTELVCSLPSHKLRAIRNHYL